MARYTISRVGEDNTVVWYHNGQQYITDSNNPNYDEIALRLFEDKTQGLEGLFSAEVLVRNQFKDVSERVSVRNGQVFFDRDPIDNVLSDHLLRLIKNGEDITDLVLFWEKIASNPNPHSREQLFKWLLAEDFSITSEGDIIGYRGLKSDYTSVHAGFGIVNGVEVNGHLDNSEGNLIEMPRSRVNHDPSEGCSVGLHVGTYEYAKNWGSGGVVVEVYVNPRDVVSVPTDCNWSKMRVCRYRVGKTVQSKHESGVVDVEPDDKNQDEESSSVFNLYTGKVVLHHGTSTTGNSQGTHVTFNVCNGC